MSSSSAKTSSRFSAYERGIHQSDDEREVDKDVFHIPSKGAPLRRLENWRKATLALNATRRFKYTLNLREEAQKEELKSKIRTHAQVVRATHRFKKMRNNRVKDVPSEGFGIGVERLAHLVREKDYDGLQQMGGVNEVAKQLDTDLDKGINEGPQDIQHRKNTYGENNYPRKAARSFFVFAWEACQDTTLIILMISAALSLALQIKTEGIKEGWYDGGSIAFAVILVILVTAISDYKQSLQFQNLNDEKRNIQLQVIRGGRRLKVSIFDLVVGDIVPLNIGDQVPADGILITGHSLSIDESSMTGESEFVYKDQKNPFLMSGCKVADGYGTMLVTGVGLNTEWGVLMASISEDNGEETPLQVRLNGVATFIGKVGLAVAIVVLIVLVIRFFTGHTENADGTPKFKAGKTKVGDAINGLVEIFAIAVTIVVVAVPEGLPMAVTLTLAYSMRKMMADKALVRRLSACETMGSATTICSDKTGTLTLNQMKVVKAFVAGEMEEPSESESVAHSLLIEGISQNTTGSVFISEGGDEIEVTGSPTEKAILSWALKFGMNFDDERSKSSILQVFTFNSEKKRGGVALKRSPFEVHIHWKGAAEIVLDLCSTWLDRNGSVQEVNPAKKDEFKKIIEGLAAASLRCIAFAYRKCDIQSVPSDEDQRQSWQIPEDNLTLLAIVGIKDPCRPNVKEAVNLCQKAGVKVRMVTGDNIYTARAIALECDILNVAYDAPDVIERTVIEGSVFRNYTEEERINIVDNISVMARSSPTDKLLFVQALRKKGHIVAVTGDGTNDAPALHEADIGLAMGIQGTEVAKESSDIIILDDNFASVVKVVRWGRSVYANIQKFVQFQLTVNVAALAINFVAAVSSGNVPLNAVQLLWVNLIMDTLGALALATEPPTDHLMHRPPVRRREPLITNVMWRNLIFQALYQIVVLVTLTFKGEDILKLKDDSNNASDVDTLKNTIIFNSFVLCQIFNEFNARKPNQINIFQGLHKNKLFIGIIGATLVLQVMIVEFLKNFAKTTRLNPIQWVICIVIGFISWPLAAIVKTIPVPEKPFSEYVLGNKFRQGHHSELVPTNDGEATSEQTTLENESQEREIQIVYR